MSTALDRLGHSRPAAPAQVSQATAIEQSRAFAEVQAAVVVAQQRPRDEDRARVDALRSCAVKAMAERSFYRYTKAGSTVSGPSVHLMRELARCWGNLQYGIAELDRDDDSGRSEMLAYAWDLQANSRSAQTFIVPHRRDKSGGTAPIIDLAGIYENNANMGARRLREAIRAILPPWYVEEAIEACAQTLRRGDGKPLQQRAAEAVQAFAALGVAADRIEQKVGRPQAAWTDQDVAQLGVIFRSLQRGEVTADQEFPAARVSVADVQASRKGNPQPVMADADAAGEALPDPADGQDPWAGETQ